ncbi:hypothetical protein FVEN_g2983 [Fusarium venenatum]|uniref:Zn(2)-C6 fungal-type domain-containing protein n=1 Tax=Fusarium venenatum TaxID=56646 RepID=A0A2L2TFZ4_9HYPO|nr:uncharacterized protein FVRRES_06372 [Fusarium venenatum]KAG8359333.1 hypothetical protein FVEN_g2983 [Fusarium venenatum]KAH6993372.1 hypothetical protein EDB82DRAFT_524456 [Fusarium venenatum]CEI61936.1 unnamed protein product [Fusarium venenatum]
MVNRGGRSKACRTCKRRRVKCDNGKPHCQRCEKAGLNCEGYVTYEEFVDETKRFSTGKPTVKSGELQLQLAHKQQQVCRPVRPLINENDIIHAHLLSKIEGVIPLMTNLESLPSSSSTRSLAIRALAAVYFGKTNSDKRIFDLGTREYVKALKKVHTDLSSSTAALEWDTLVSVLCLCMFETIAFTDKNGWLRHYEGISQLVKLRGPWRHRTPLDRELLRQCRFEIIVCALIKRCHCYLEMADWQTIPWPADVPKTSSDTLHEIFARVSGQLHDMDILERGEVDDDFADRLHQRVETTLSDLEDWGLLYHHPRPLSGSIPNNEAQHTVKDKALLALQRAIILCMSDLCMNLRIPLVAEIPVAFEDQQTIRTAIAIEICQLAISSLGEESTGTEPLLFIFPLQIACMNLLAGSAELKMAEEVMNDVIAGTHGFEIGRRRELRSWRLDCS